MKSYEHLNLSRASVVQFRASRHITRPNRTSVWKVMAFFFSLLFPQSFTSGPQNLPLSPSARLFIAKQDIWGHDSSSRWAGYFTMKLFGGLGKPRVKKSFQLTLLPSLLGIFCILYWNFEKSFVLSNNWCQAAQFS